MASLESILDGEEVVEQETKEETPETPEPEATEVADEESTDPEVETAEIEETPEPKGDTESKDEEATPPVAEDVKTVPLAAVLDERDKRKELQRQIDELKSQQDKEKAEKVDFWENPEAAVQVKVDEVKSELNQKFTSNYLALSMQYSKSFHEDFDSAKDAFAKAAEENPALADMALQSEMPGEYIYSTGKQFMELDAVGGDVNALRDQIRNEERAKLLEELKSKEDKLKDVPVPLTDETSATAPREKVQGGATPLDSILTTNR